MIGTIKETSTGLDELTATESGKQPVSLASAKYHSASNPNGLYTKIYRYDPNTDKYIILADTDKLEPGIGYFIYAIKPFTLKLA